MSKISELEIFRIGYPRAFFFRVSEVYAPKGEISFEEWEKIFIRLSGIMGKTLEEEVPGRSKNIPWFTLYKKRHPEKVVLLHYNGNARDPRDGGEKFFAGHWLYFNGCRITQDVPAEEGISKIHVENPSLFRVNMGRYRNKNEDICLCLLDEDGKPDWHHSEQVQLISINHERKVLEVKRGCFGTKPIALPANKSYAAAHVTEGPWGGEDANLMWFYNYSTKCPRDAQGRTCIDILVEDVASRFLPGGDLEHYDGLEFDVLKDEPTYIPPYLREGRGVDVDGDGKIDYGWIDGINTYRIGVYEFCRRLRRKLGEDRIIQADGMAVSNQRCFGVLNGIESEGWPALWDVEVEDWSGGLNRHFFWSENARRPVFNYINHKFVRRVKVASPGTEAAVDRRPPVLFNIHRLVFAAAQFFDAAICYSYAPDPEPGEAVGIWDELVMGVERRLGWLGFPLGPAVRLAKQTPDLLGGAGEEMTREFAERLEGENVEFTVEGNVLRVAAKDEEEESLRFRVTDIPCEGEDLFVSLRIKAAEMKNYPIDIPRLAWVRISSEKEPKRFMTWTNPNWFEASFYFRETNTKNINLTFEVESNEPIWIKDFTVYAHPDAIIREFDNGLVLANPSLHDYTFNLDVLTPRRKYRRLIGSSRQDPETNNGSPVESEVTLKPKDGLFLVKTN